MRRAPRRAEAALCSPRLKACRACFLDFHGEEAGMVQIIEAEYCIEFKVQRTTAGNARGQWQYAREEPGPYASIPGSKPFTPIEDEYRRCVACALASGVPFVWVNDPERLFPPSKRPAV
jgi:hypothetical protein